jgi:hypothetical protein
VALSTVTRDGVSEAAVTASERVYVSSGTPFYFRTHAQIEQLFDGLELLPPGIEDVYRSEFGRVIGGRAIKQ